MASTIKYCLDNPIKISLNDWMSHIGRASVIRSCNDYYEVLAYSDNNSDFSELSKFAKKNKAKYMKSILSEGVTAID